MNKLTVAGIILVVFAVVILVYGEFTYTTEETIVEIGPLEATAETEESVRIPPALGWVVLGAGGVLLILGVLRQTRMR